MKKTLLLLFICSSAITFGQKTMDQLLKQYNTQSVPYISVEELRMAQLNQDVIVLDSREQVEYDVSHIENAHFVGFNHFSSEEFETNISDKEAPIVVYCSLGIRSEEIAEKLKKAGYLNVQNLYGGIFEWKNKGYPVITSEGKETENIHTFSKAWSKWLIKGIKVY